MSQSKISRNSLVKRVVGMAVVGAAVGVAVPVLANGAPTDGPDAAAPAHRAPQSAAVPFIVTDGATSGEVGIDPRELTAADGAELVRNGAITLAIKTSGPATVSAMGTSQVGNEPTKAGTTAPKDASGWVEVGRDSERITEPASVAATGAGVIQLTLRLTAAARAAYAAGADQPMLLRISSSNSPASLITYLPMAAG